MHIKLTQLLFIGFSLLSLTCYASSNPPIEQARELKSSGNNPLTIEALAKIKTLESMMTQARSKGIDSVREETVIWFAKEFLKYADWDENNQAAVAYLFGEYYPYKKDKDKLAAEIPDFQRKMVVKILDQGITELSLVLRGEIKRRPVNKVDWRNIEISNNMLLNGNGRPVFLYDYFSKSVGRPLTDKRVYNDHLGAIFHGGENLYPVDHDRAINSFLLKEDRTFDQELLRELTEIPDTNVGFLIYWNMGIPKWVEEQEPEVRKGRSLFTGYDIDNPLARELWGTIAKETGAMTQNKKVSQLGYILANEPHWYAVDSNWTRRTGEMQNISSYTLKKYQEWLNKKYHSDLDRLNANWGTEFTGFDSVEVEVPIPADAHGTPYFYDFARYNMDRAINWFTFLQGELRKGNSNADTHIKIMPHLYTGNSRYQGIDLEALTELTSMIGDDAKARESRSRTAKGPEKWEEHYAYFWEELSMSYDFMESVSPNKIHINSESHFLSAGNWRKLDTSIEYVESVYWLATLQGMDANMAWFWARDPDGSPEDRLEGELDFFDNALAGSFAGSINQQPHIANAYTQVMYDLNSFSEEIIALRQQRRPLRLFHSETSAINKKNHMSQQFDLYEKLFFEGFPVGFATENIINKQSNSRWDAILVYQTEFVTQTELEALQSYLNKGGTVIMDSDQNLLSDEYGQAHNNPLQASNGKLFVLDGKHSLDEIRDFAISKINGGRAEITLIENNDTNKKGCQWLAVKQKDGSYLVSILNLGKHTAKLTLGLKNASAINVIDLFTENTVASQYELAPKGVSLLRVRSL